MYEIETSELDIRSRSTLSSYSLLTRLPYSLLFEKVYKLLVHDNDVYLTYNSETEDRCGSTKGSPITGLVELTKECEGFEMLSMPLGV